MSTSEKVKQWWPIADKWCQELQVSQSLVMAVIHAESSGDPKAVRYEPEFEKRYIAGNETWQKRCKELGMTAREVATSYGLMQLMFSTAYGYGCRSVKEALNPEQNIQFGVAHLAMLIKKHDGIGAALAAYNGGDGAVADMKAGKDTAATRYSKKVFALFEEYRAEALAAKATPTAAVYVSPTGKWRKNFDFEEFYCQKPCPDCNCTAFVRNDDLADLMQEIRDEVKKVVTITSGTRCVGKNKKSGGAPDSGHLTGESADFSVSGMTAAQVGAVLKKMHGAGKLKKLAYSYLVSATAVHVGVDKKARSKIFAY